MFISRLQFISNILKDLQHEHIVRYHDRYVDRDAGVLYILMEYCGGGDLSSVIKQSQRQDKPIPEEIIWNYFMQILLALSYCHHPNGHSRSGSSSTGTDTEGGKDKRPQILHRDLKPDNGELSPLRLYPNPPLILNSVPGREQQSQTWRLWPLQGPRPG